MTSQMSQSPMMERMIASDELMRMRAVAMVHSSHTAAVAAAAGVVVIWPESVSEPAPVVHGRLPPLVPVLDCYTSVRWRLYSILMTEWA